MSQTWETQASLWKEEEQSLRATYLYVRRTQVLQTGRRDKSGSVCMNIPWLCRSTELGEPQFQSPKKTRPKLKTYGPFSKALGLRLLLSIYSSLIQVSMRGLCKPFQHRGLSVVPPQCFVVVSRNTVQSPTLMPAHLVRCRLHGAGNARGMAKPY